MLGFVLRRRHPTLLQLKRLRLSFIGAMAPAQPTVFSILDDDTVVEDGHGNTFLFTKLPTSRYRPRVVEAVQDTQAASANSDQTEYIVR